jgi:methionyl aminopeptidase
VVSEDGGWSAHFEHTVAITPDGPWVLTALTGPPAGVLVPAGIVGTPVMHPHGAG